MYQIIKEFEEKIILVLEKKFRISSYGDSFVHCDDVSNENTWQSFIEQREKNLRF